MISIHDKNHKPIYINVNSTSIFICIDSLAGLFIFI